MHSDMITAWALHDELTEKGLSPHQETWDALFEGSRKINCSDLKEVEKLFGILLYMRNNQIYPQHNLATSIKAWFERYSRVIWENMLLILHTTINMQNSIKSLFLSPVSQSRSGQQAGPQRPHSNYILYTYIQYFITSYFLWYKEFISIG